MNGAGFDWTCPHCDHATTLTNERLCDEYVQVAVKHLVLGIAQKGPREDESSPSTFDCEAERLRIHFLFPFIAKPAFDLLLGLRDSRWILTAVQINDETARTVRSAHDLEWVEAQHDQRTREIEGSLSAFSQVQQEILREKFIRTDVG